MWKPYAQLLSTPSCCGRPSSLQSIEPRLKPGGKYEMATLELVEETPLERSTVIELVKKAVALNASHGDPTDLRGKHP